MYFVISVYLVYLVAISIVFVSWTIYIHRRHKQETQKLSKEYEALVETQSAKERIHKDVLDIAHYIALHTDFDKTLQEILPKLAESVRSSCCAFYTLNNASRLSLKHSMGFGKNVYSEFDLTVGEGFIGSLALKKEITIIYDVPDDTIYLVRTFLGKIKPKSIMIVPIIFEDQLNGVLAIASIYTYTKEELEFVETIRYYLGVAVSNGVNAEKTKRLSSELAFQNKLIQNQHDEMHNRLRDKETLINHLISSLDYNLIYVLDYDYKVLYWTKTAKTIYGLPPERAVGKHIDQINSDIGFEPIYDVLQRLPNGMSYSTKVTNPGNESFRLEIWFSQLDSTTFGVIAKVNEAD